MSGIQSDRGGAINGGKTYYLGIFANFEDAVKARKEAEMKYFGEFSPKED